MSELTDFADLVLKENPTEEELREIERLSPKYRIKEKDGLDPTMVYRFVYPDSTEQTFIGQAETAKATKVGTGTLRKYRNTGIPVQNGKNKGVLIYSEVRYESK